MLCPALVPSPVRDTVKAYHGFLLIGLIWAASAQAAAEKAVLDVVPSLSEAGPAWTTNVMAYLLDPRSHPSEIDYRHDTKTSPMLALQRENMKKDGRNGFGIVLYGRGNMIMHQGLYRVYIYRWDNERALHNRWVDWKMTPARIVRSAPPVGEDCFWSDDGMFQEFAFRRGLFQVVMEADSSFQYRPIVQLAEVIDLKIRGQPIPKAAKPATN
jgi:hypothetical protein